MRARRRLCSRAGVTSARRMSMPFVSPPTRAGGVGASGDRGHDSQGPRGAAGGTPGWSQHEVASSPGAVAGFRRWIEVHALDACQTGRVPTYDGALEAANAAKKTAVLLRRAEACALLIANVDDSRRAAAARDPVLHLVVGHHRVHRRRRAVSVEHEFSTRLVPGSQPGRSYLRIPVACCAYHQDHWAGGLWVP